MAKRRGSGEGSIFERKDGRWVAALDVGWREGKRRRVLLYAKSRGEARDKLREAQRRQDAGTLAEGRRQRLGPYLEVWLASLDGVVRDSTRENYATIVHKHLIPSLGRIWLDQLTPAQVQRMLTTKAAAGLSPRTVAYIRKLLVQALARAERWGMVQRNVARLVSAPRVPHQEVIPLSAEDAKRLLGAAEGDRLHALWAVAIAIGLRRGEALALTWDDVDLDARTLRVRRTLKRTKAGLVFDDPKSVRSRRTIPLPETCVAALRAHRVRQAEERLAAGSHWEDHGLVFPSRVGTPLDPRNALREFSRLCERAGLPATRIHDLRHTCASLLAAQGVEPRVVMEILGHSGIAITMDLYTHLFPATQRRAADAMDALLGDSQVTAKPAN